MKFRRGPPMTLEAAVTNRIEPEIPPRWLLEYGAGTPVFDWRARLVCSRCGSRQVDMVVTGTERR
jgi:hypothetical protein